MHMTIRSNGTRPQIDITLRLKYMMSENVVEEEFDWIKLQNDIRAVEETRKEKLIRKIKENPFIPIGCLATTCALSYGLWSFRKGDRKMSQYMMRTRVVAQGFTVLSLVVGLGMGVSKIERNK